MVVPGMESHQQRPLVVDCSSGAFPAWANDAELGAVAPAPGLRDTGYQIKMKPDNFAGTPFSPLPCRVSIIIKALNEEACIRTTVESALRAVSTVGGEVILADSFSTDRTVELASAYPIRIVQLVNAHERRCGAGPQLGYQHSQGEFVYILDGDMRMREGFLGQALAFLGEHSRAAGVGGRVVEHNTESLEYISRAEHASTYLAPSQVDRLDGGGLYRREAIEAAGYFSDRNLHSYEELDLATRLRAGGWELWRLPLDACDHSGHDAPPYRLLMRRWRTRYVCGLGELIRSATGEPRLQMILRGVRELRIYAAVLLWWLTLATVPFWPLPAPVRAAAFMGILAAPVLVMTWRKRSASKALYSVVSWCFQAAGLLRGFFHARQPARQAILSRVLHEPARAPLGGSGGARN